jgi:FkbM family methyltransferase
LKPLTPSTVEFRNGLRCQLEESGDLETLWLINFHNMYPLEPSDKVILDAGANIGLFACWAAQRNPDAAIVAIEPFPRNFDRLMEHVSQNAFGQRIQGLQSALSSSNGTANISTVAEASQMLRVTGSQAPGSVEAPTLTLAAVVEQMPYSSIDLMKMDIEGSEYDVLLSTPPTTFARIRRISLEYHPSPEGRRNKKDLASYLRSCGYTSVRDCGGASEYGMIHFSR